MLVENAKRIFWCEMICKYVPVQHPNDIYFVES